MPDIYQGGTVFAVSASAPATIDSTGFAALTYSTIGTVTMWDKQGDTSEAITIKPVSGRNYDLNGPVTGGDVPFEYEFTLADAGQVILRAQSNTQTQCSIKETHTDGKILYYSGYVANVQFKPRVANVSKGQMGIFRIKTATVVV